MHAWLRHTLNGAVKVTRLWKIGRDIPRENRGVGNTWLTKVATNRITRRSKSRRVKNEAKRGELRSGPAVNDTHLPIDELAEVLISA